MNNYLTVFFLCFMPPLLGMTLKPSAKQIEVEKYQKAKTEFWCMKEALQEKDILEFYKKEREFWQKEELRKRENQTVDIYFV